MRKRLWCLGSGLAVVIASIMLLRYNTIDRLDLLNRSTRITSVRGWGMERPDLDIPARIYSMMSGGAQYQWVGNRQILFFHDLKPIQATEKQTNRGPIHVLNWPASIGTPTLDDVAAHCERPLPRLAELFRHDGGKAGGTAVSPDGSHLLWPGDQDHIHAAMLDGSRHVSVEANTQAGWLADRKRFYTYGWSEDNHKKDVIAVQLWDANTGDYLDELQFAQPKGYDLLCDCALMPDGSLATNTLNLPRVKLTLYRISPKPASVAHAVTPVLPSGATVEAMVYSPRCDRLAWIINRTIPSPLACLQRWLPHYKPMPQRLASLWVSGAMGENLHEVGHIPVRQGGRQFYLIDYVRWQPDGKTLSFVSNDILYTVPAN